MKKILPFLIIAIILAAIAAPLASSWPDGLGKAAQVLGFDRRATDPPVMKAPLPDYHVPGLRNSPLSGSIAGLAGAMICFVVPFGFYLLRKK